MAKRSRGSEEKKEDSDKGENDNKRARTNNDDLIENNDSKTDASVDPVDDADNQYVQEVGDKGPLKHTREVQLKFGLVCSSNMNRSMEAHKQFQRHNLEVSSYGVGQRIRLPGPLGQNVFDFGTSYQAIRDKLIEQGEEDWYRERGLLGMVERNIRLKDAPERFQECNNQEVVVLDIIFCFEGRVFDLLVEDLEGREPQNFEPIHVLNLEVKDTPEEAEIGARIALELCEALQQHHDKLEHELPRIVQDIEERYGRDILSKTCYV